MNEKATITYSMDGWLDDDDEECYLKMKVVQNFLRDKAQERICYPQC